MREILEQKLYSLDVRGEIGYSGGFGLIAFGWNRFGFYNVMCGIYAKFRTLKGPKLVRKVFYRPTNPQTVPQQAWRSIFADGKVAWDSLTLDQKKLYNKKAQSRRMTGYNLFMSQWLQSRR